MGWEGAGCAPLSSLRPLTYPPHSGGEDDAEAALVEALTAVKQAQYPPDQAALQRPGCPPGGGSAGGTSHEWCPPGGGSAGGTHHEWYGFLEVVQIPIDLDYKSTRSTN